MYMYSSMVWYEPNIRSQQGFVSVCFNVFRLSYHCGVFHKTEFRRQPINLNERLEGRYILIFSTGNSEGIF